MRDIMRQLTHEVEMSLRIRLAERLVAQKGNAQHDLVVVLANDRIEVAHPMLVASEVLDDEDLIEIVQPSLASAPAERCRAPQSFGGSVRKRWSRPRTKT